MKKQLMIALALFLSAPFAYADSSHKKVDPVARLVLLPQGPIIAGQAVTVLAKLISVQNGHALSEADLQLVHTRKFHLLVIDPSLTDYQHIHPATTDVPGLWSFTFRPKTSNGYRAFADITPLATNVQEYDEGSIGKVVATSIDTTPSLKMQTGGYYFNLSFDGDLKAGSAVMGTLSITNDKDKPIENLEPVMGAFAHIVAFSDDRHSVAHVHPLGDEPKDASARGTSPLTFHLEPKKSGFLKIFAQVRINGTEFFVPFGVMVK